MDVLVLGGTHFVGRQVVEQALARGHQVTLFNRGLSNPDLFPDAERLVGDRNDDLQALRGRAWDVVFDPSAFVPESVRRMCEALRGNVGSYTFISSAACYDVDRASAPLTEASPVRQLDDPDNVDLHRDANYGPLKAACEQMLAEQFDGTALTIRPGLIGGPEDLTDRFTYWPRRIACGGDVLAPTTPDRPIQVLDIRDLAEWVVDMAERGQGGTFNAGGPATCLGELFAACQEVTSGHAQLIWTDEAFLLDERVTPWSELPLWMPGRAALCVSALSSDAAVRAGLRYRPIETTIRDTWTWDAQRPRPLPRGPVGARYVVETMEPERERDLLRRWRRRRAQA